MRQTIVALGILGMLGLSGCPKRQPLPPVNEFRDGDQVNLVLPRWPDRTPHDLATDRGNVVLLDVWATWCDPCRDALPVYEQFAKHYGPQGLRVYTINMDEDPQRIEPFLREIRVDLPVLLEQDAIAERSLGVKLMPSTFLLDRQGRLRHRHEGFVADHVPKYRSELEKLLAER